MIHGRAWTSERLQRHGLLNHGPCALCSQCPELLDHLLLTCVYSGEVWFKTLRRCGWQSLVPAAADFSIQWWLRSRKMVQKARRKSFDSLFILVTWHLWLERNARVFQGKSTAAHSLVSSIWQAADQWCLAKIMLRPQLLGF